MKTVGSDVESEQDNVSVRYDIVFAFDPHKSFFTCRMERAFLKERFVIDYLGLDKAPFKIAVDPAVRKLIRPRVL